MTVSHVRGSDTGHLIEHTFPQLARQYARKQKKNQTLKKKQDKGIWMQAFTKSSSVQVMFCYIYD